METHRILLMIAIGVLAVTVGTAQPVTTDKPVAETHVDRKNGVETSIPGTVPQGADTGNTVLQSAAGTIYSRPDGRKVLVGDNGLTIATRGDDSSEESNENGFQFGVAGSNVLINGGQVGGSNVVLNNGKVLIMKQAGEGSYQTYNNYQIRIVGGGLQLTVDGQVYDFPAKEAGVNTEEKVKINGQDATVRYENGNIAVELADGTVLAKADGGLFSGDRESYANRKQIQEQTVREIAEVQRNVAEIQKNLQLELENEMTRLREQLGRTLGGLDFGF